MRKLRAFVLRLGMKRLACGKSFLGARGVPPAEDGQELDLGYRPRWSPAFAGVTSLGLEALLRLGGAQMPPFGIHESSTCRHHMSAAPHRRALTETQVPIKSLNNAVALARVAFQALAVQDLDDAATIPDGLFAL